MNDEARRDIEPRQRKLSDAFFDGEAAQHREHVALRAEEIAARDLIAEATGISDDRLLAELAGLGIRVDTLSALTLVPLIEIAWADGRLDAPERHAVLAGAVSVGIEPGSTSYRLLEIWMQEQHAPDLVALWRDFVGALCRQLDPEQRQRLERNVLGRARSVAAAAGDARERSPHVSEIEEARLAELAQAFRD
jgi:hypothetical protein